MHNYFFIPIPEYDFINLKIATRLFLNLTSGYLMSDFKLNTYQHVNLKAKNTNKFYYMLACWRQVLALMT